MNQPQIELVPVRPAVSNATPTTLDLIVRGIPPRLRQVPDRPALNLGLVVDRSGSMSGSKIEHAKLAARQAVEQLLPTDRVSVTIFDDAVETIVPSTLAADRLPILAAIGRVGVDGSTALHAGWVEGAAQVAAHLQPERLNRVILLSDGHANVGETNPDVIATDVRALARRGVSTTTMGVGRDYDEDLMMALAASGEGNYHFIESPAALPAILAAELRGLMATFGRRVSLGLEPQSGAIVRDVLNDLDRNQLGRLMLPDLAFGSPIEVVVRLKVPAAHTGEILRVRLAWDDPETGIRHKLRAALRLPAISPDELDALPANPEVLEKVALLEAARAKAEAARRMDAHDLAGAQASLAAAGAALGALPASPALAAESTSLADLAADLSSGDSALARKRALSQRYARQRSR